LDQHGKAELIRALRREYARASKRKKSRIIDQLVSATGFSRKHMPSPGSMTARRHRRESDAREQGATKPSPRNYSSSGRQPTSSAASACSPSRKNSSKRSSATARSFSLTNRKRSSHLSARPPSTEMTLKGRATTKPGALLKHQTPIRTYADWDGDRPGSLEVTWARTAAPRQRANTPTRSPWPTSEPGGPSAAPSWAAASDSASPPSRRRAGACRSRASPLTRTTTPSSSTHTCSDTASATASHSPALQALQEERPVPCRAEELGRRPKDRRIRALRNSSAARPPPSDLEAACRLSELLPTLAQACLQDKAWRQGPAAL